MPKGTGGSEPELALRYESDLSDGPFGVGWRVELGEIRRTARFGTPKYDSTDQFEFDGVLLVAHPENPGEYRTFQESFARIKRTLDGSGEWWMVEFSDGLKARFGTNQETRIRVGGSIDYENDNGPIGRWLLSELEDVSGNITRFSYDRVSDIGTAYPESVTYTYRAGDQTPIGGATMERRAQFVLEDRSDEMGREQVIFGYPLGIETRVGKRVSEIQSLVGSQVYRRMVLTYANSAGYDTGRSRLWKVQLFGTDCPIHQNPATCQGLPARTFSYTNSDSIGSAVGAQWDPTTEWRQEDSGISLHFTTGENQAQGRDRGVRVGDINGDGYPDYVQAWKKALNTTGPYDPLWEIQHEVYLNDGSGWGTLNNSWKDRLAELTVPVNVVREVRRGADADETCSTRDYYSSDYDTFVTFRSENPFNAEQRAIYNVISSHVEARLVDLNADGFSDIIISFEIGAGSSTSLSRCGVRSWDAPVSVKRVFINNGLEDPDHGGGWTDETATWAAALPVFYSIYLRSDGGSGSESPGIAWAPGKWRGNLEKPKDPSRGITYAHFVDHGVRMPDLNGDGRPDIVVKRDPVTFGSGSAVKSFPDGAWLSRPNGTGWVYTDSYRLPVSLVAEFNFLSGYPKYVHDADAGVRFADVNGDGLADLVKTAVNPGSGHGRLSATLRTEGVWLNTGSGWCGALSGNPECIAARKYLPPTNFTTISSVYQPPSQMLWGGGNLPLVRSSELSFVDLNGDGLVDLVKTDHPALTGMNAWIHDPSRPQIWRQDDRYVPDDIMSTTGRYVSNGKLFIFDDGVRIFDFNGDATVDFMRDRLQTPAVPRAIHLSKSAQMDLLELAENGQGGSQKFGYTSAIEQRNAELESLARADADSLNEAGSIGLPRWTARPIVSSLETRDSLAGGGVHRATMTYAMPRWDPVKRSLLGFRAVEVRHSDAPEIEMFQVKRAYFWQQHGRAGRVSRVEIYDALGDKLHERTLNWATLPGSPDEGSIAGVHIGRLIAETETNHYEDGAGPIREIIYGYLNGVDTHGYNFVHEIRTIRPTGTLTIRRQADRTDTGARWIKGLLAKEIYETENSELLSETVFDRDERGLPRSVTRTIKQRYVTDAPEFARATYLFDTYGNLVQTVDPENRTTFFCYDGDATFADGSACPDDMGTDTHTLVVGVKDPLGEQTRFSGRPVDLASGRLTAIDRLYSGDSDWIDVDPFDRPIRLWTKPANRAQEVILATREYLDDPDAPGNDAGRPYIVERAYFDERSAEDDAASVRTAIYLDGLGRQMASVSPRAPGVAFPFGRAITERDYAGRATRGTLDIACADAHCTNLPEATHPNVEEITQSYDPLGRVMTRRTPDGVMAFAYRRVFFVPPAVFGAMAPGPLDAVLSKDANGVLTEHLLDGKRVVVARECDAVAPDRTNLTGVACSNPVSTFYTYEASGEVATIYDATTDYGSAANRLTYRYDTLGRVYLIEDPDGGMVFTSYDKVGNVEQTMNVSAGATTNVVYEYDELDRLKTRNTPPQNGDWDLALEYDRNTRKRAAVTSSGSYSEIWEYDDFGNLKTNRRSINNRTLRTDFQHDLLGRRVMIQSPLESVEGASYGYDGAYLTRVCSRRDISDCEAEPSKYHIDDVAYDALGRAVTISEAPGDLTFDYYSMSDGEIGRAVNRVKQIKLDDDGARLNLAYQYNGAGQVIRVDDDHTTADALDASAIYDYDQRGRLMSWTAEHYANEPKYFAYDELGNLRGRELEDPDSAWNQFYFDGETGRAGEGGPHAISINQKGKSYRYDERGNVTQRGSDEFITYNSLGQIYCVGAAENTCTTFFWYDIDGKLLSKTTGSTSEIYLGDYFRFDWRTNVAWTYTSAFGVRIVAEKKTGASLRPAGAPAARPGTANSDALVPWIVGGSIVGIFALLACLGVLSTVGERPALASIALALSALIVVPPHTWAARNAGGKGGKVGGGKTYIRYLFHDHLGSEVLALDGSGVTVERRIFGPFGEVIASRTDLLASVAASFTGKAYHADMRWYYFGARWYDPEAGRFVSVDPIVQSIADPQTHNPYSYVRNNPIGNIDPDGREYGERRESPGSGIGPAVGLLASALNSLIGGDDSNTTTQSFTPNATATSVDRVASGHSSGSLGESVTGGPRSTAWDYHSSQGPQGGVQNPLGPNPGNFVKVEILGFDVVTPLGGFEVTLIGFFFGRNRAGEFQAGPFVEAGPAIGIGLSADAGFEIVGNIDTLDRSLSINHVLGGGPINAQGNINPTPSNHGQRIIGDFVNGGGLAASASPPFLPVEGFVSFTQTRAFDVIGFGRRLFDR
ncbi:MAG: hypothetical protein JRF15_15145 [Deltaproteobacteria bacterium]|nr:hypothetical protein [Deltaproteobacteria bacterium]